MPSTGLDKWYQLEARSQRSNIQGSLRLKLWLSTREDHGQTCTQNNFDNWTDVRRHERLLTIFADYEMSLTKSVCRMIFNWRRLFLKTFLVYFISFRNITEPVERWTVSRGHQHTPPARCTKRSHRTSVGRDTVACFQSHTIHRSTVPLKTTVTAGSCLGWTDINGGRGK